MKDKNKTYKIKVSVKNGKKKKESKIIASASSIFLSEVHTTT